jgi:two-component system, cell cycle response regulator
MHITLIEPSKTSARVMETMIRALGYNDVAVFHDGKLAWDYIRAPSTPVDLVLTSMEAPGMSGLEICWNMRCLDKTKLCFIMVISSHSSDDAVVDALDCGADDFVRKPPNQTVLWARLRAGQRLIRLQKDLAHAANHDPLTNCYNRRAFSVAAATAMREAEETGAALSLLMVDIDHFKRINDQYGHDIGDIAIRAFADAAQACFLPPAVVGRLGGEEFAILLPAATAESGAHLAEMFRVHVENYMITIADDHVSMTVSAGLATLHTGESIESLMKRADLALYAAKSAGRNQLQLAA